jgi:hypothetical protein
LPHVFTKLEAVRRTAARTTLSGLMMWLGEPGLDVADGSPALMSVLDQHAAQIRDSLGDSADGPNVVALAGYATGIRDALIEAGWTLAPIPEVDWSKPEWPTLRLLAVCLLARTHNFV